MSLLDKIVSTFAPYDCLGCGIEGSLLCGDCLALFGQLPERCYRCRKLSPGNKTCNSCRSSSVLRVVEASTTYEFIAKELVWQLKFQGAQAAANQIAQFMASLLSTEGVVLVHVPTASSRVRQRGYDQAMLIAKALSRQTGLPHRTSLGRLGQHHQVGMGREQRVTQLAKAFRVLRPGSVAGKHIVLIDDVLTTGATLEAAARALKAAGAKHVDALVFAQV